MNTKNITSFRSSIKIGIFRGKSYRQKSLTELDRFMFNQDIFDLSQSMSNDKKSNFSFLLPEFIQPLSCLVQNYASADSDVILQVVG